MLRRQIAAFQKEKYLRENSPIFAFCHISSAVHPVVRSTSKCESSQVHGVQPIQSPSVGFASQPPTNHEVVEKIPMDSADFLGDGTPRWKIWWANYLFTLGSPKKIPGIPLRIRWFPLWKTLVQQVILGGLRITIHPAATKTAFQVTCFVGGSLELADRVKNFRSFSTNVSDIGRCISKLFHSKIFLGIMI